MDVVYFVKDCWNNTELRHSIRSVCENLEYDRIWIFGGCPRDIIPDVRVRVDQVGKTKWDRVRSMFRMAAENKEISDDFILFNDDFFVMDSVEKVEPMYHCTLKERIESLPKGPYRSNLQNAYDFLKDKVDEPLSYELHVPFVFNKAKLLKLINEYPDLRSTRTIYGNLYKIGGKQINDVKVFNGNPGFEYRESTFLSTDDGVVNPNNMVWRYIKNNFSDRCKYELG